MITKPIASALLVLAVSFTAAAADVPRPPTPPPAPSGAPPSCKAEGTPVFQATTRPSRSEPAKGLTLPITTVFGSGAWTYAETTDGKLGRRSSGCLDPAERKTIESALASSPWKVSPVAFRCEALAATAIDYASRGKALFTAELCGENQLDDVSAKHLAEITAILDKLTRPSELETGGHKPS